MQFTLNYFGKEQIEEISIQDLRHFFSIEREESDKIEFKSFHLDEGSTQNQKEREKAVIKTICAFLNSEGGLLIWGAPKGTSVQGKNEKVFTGELSLVEYSYEKDQMISKITDSLTPIPRGINFHRIENEKAFVYLFEVEKSEYSPHQFGDRFFMRIDGQSKPAPYHYIEALFKKIKYPNLHGYLKPEGWQLQGNKFLLHFTVWIFNLSKLQNDYDVSYRIFCGKGVFQHWNGNFKSSNTSYHMSGHEMRKVSVKEIIHYGEPIRQQETIEFDPHELEKVNWESPLVLMFGARNSPMKMSKYRLNLRDITDEKVNLLFNDRHENELMGKSDLNEDERINKILGRL